MDNTIKNKVTEIVDEDGFVNYQREDQTLISDEWFIPQLTDPIYWGKDKIIVKRKIDSLYNVLQYDGSFMFEQWMRHIAIETDDKINHRLHIVDTNFMHNLVNEDGTMVFKDGNEKNLKNVSFDLIKGGKYYIISQTCPGFFCYIATVDGVIITRQDLSYGFIHDFEPTSDYVCVQNTPQVLNIETGWRNCQDKYNLYNIKTGEYAFESDFNRITFAFKSKNGNLYFIVKNDRNLYNIIDVDGHYLLNDWKKNIYPIKGSPDNTYCIIRDLKGFYSLIDNSGTILIEACDWIECISDDIYKEYGNIFMFQIHGYTHLFDAKKKTDITPSVLLSHKNMNVLRLCASNNNCIFVSDKHRHNIIQDNKFDFDESESMVIYSIRERYVIATRTSDKLQNIYDINSKEFVFNNWMNDIEISDGFIDRYVSIQDESTRLWNIYDLNTNTVLSPDMWFDSCDCFRIIEEDINTIKEFGYIVSVNNQKSLLFVDDPSDLTFFDDIKIETKKLSNYYTNNGLFKKNGKTYLISSFRDIADLRNCLKVKLYVEVSPMSFDKDQIGFIYDNGNVCKVSISKDDCPYVCTVLGGGHIEYRCKRYKVLSIMDGIGNEHNDRLVYEEYKVGDTIGYQCGDGGSYLDLSFYRTFTEALLSAQK